MARPRRTAPRGRYRDLDFPQKFDLTAGRGARPGDERSPWTNEAERRQAWETHADELLHWPRVDHSRALSWWEYTPNIPDDLREHGSGTFEEDEELQRRRWQYLEARGLWVPGEREAAIERGFRP